jgi:hypothetical protein
MWVYICFIGWVFELIVSFWKGYTKQTVRMIKLSNKCLQFYNLGAGIFAIWGAILIYDDNQMLDTMGNPM